MEVKIMTLEQMQEHIENLINIFGADKKVHDFDNPEHFILTVEHCEDSDKLYVIFREDDQ